MPTEITEEELKELETLEKKSTPGEWDFTYDGSGDWSLGRKEDPQHFRVCHLGYREDMTREQSDYINLVDALFITKVKNILPRLIQAYREKDEEAMRYFRELNAMERLEALGD